jgi:hypothetical protein
VVVKGIAQVTRGSDRFELHENESVFILQRMKHRLENASQPRSPRSARRSRQPPSATASTACSCAR